MKITIIGNNPIYVSKDRGEAVKQALQSGTEFINIDGNLYKASAITAITNDPAPHRFGMDVERAPNDRRLKMPVSEQATPDSPGYKRFQEMKARLLRNA